MLFCVCFLKGKSLSCACCPKKWSVHNSFTSYTCQSTRKRRSFHFVLINYTNNWTQQQRKKHPVSCLGITNKRASRFRFYLTSSPTTYHIIITSSILEFFKWKITFLHFTLLRTKYGICISECVLLTADCNKNNWKWFFFITMIKIDTWVDFSLCESWVQKRTDLCEVSYFFFLSTCSKFGRTLRT